MTPRQTYNIMSAYKDVKKKKRTNSGHNSAILYSKPISEELIVAGDLNEHVGVEKGGFERWNGDKTRGKICSITTPTPGR